MTDPVLKRAFAVLQEWIPFSADDYASFLSRCTAEDRACFRKEELDGLTYCLFSWPLYRADSVPFDLAADAPASAVCEQWVQTEIVLDASGKDPVDAEVLLYTNAYTSKRYRQRHILTHMLKMTEETVLSRQDSTTLLSCISLDPDVACYGEDRTDTPYIYSMKDEPARLENAEILRHLGWQPLKLMTDEPVEDGAILWFAFRRAACVTI